MNEPIELCYAVDIPLEEDRQEEEGQWRNVGKFRTKAEAVAFIRDTIGPCDDDGNVCLITALQLFGNEDELKETE